MVDPNSAPSPNIFGQMWSATAAERAVIALLQERFSTYLAEIEAREPNYAKGDILRPRTWQADIDADKLPEAQVPAIVVIVGTEAPTSDGRYLHSTIGLVVAAIVRGTTRAHGRELARLYAAAIRPVLLHNPDVNGAFARLSYDGAAYGEQAGDPGVVAATATLSFTATVGNTTDLWAGPKIILPYPPSVPGWPDYPGDPLVDETIVDVQPVEEVPQP